ncbi:MAG TPA: S9 family peptidase [Gemmatimonadaceae bacterium]|nr:S9 family peptidase [Gemmatimonadaceae bacterium]
MRTLILAATLLLAPSVLPAQDQKQDSILSVAKYLDFETVADPRISPDGSQIVYTRRWVNAQEDRWDSALWIMNADGSRNRFLVKGANAAWSADGKRIAYLAEGEPKGTQIFVRWIDGNGESTQITRLTQTPADIRWSPDGSTIAFTMLVPATPSSAWKIDLPTPKGAKWTDAPRIVERLHYRQDRRGFQEIGYTHLFTVSAEGGTPKQLTKGEWSVGARFDQLPGGVVYAWTPDGRTIVVEGLQDSTADLNYRDAALFAVNVADGATRRLTAERGTWHSPVVSPDGRRIAYAGAPYGRYSYRAEDVWVMDADGSNARLLTKGFDRDPGDLAWSSDGSTVYFTAAQNGSLNVYAVPASSGTPRAVTSGVQAIALGSVARTGAAAGTRSTPTQPGDVVRIQLAGAKGSAAGSVAQLTHVNDDLLAGVKVGAVKELWMTSTNGARVQGWIVTPPGFDASRKYPMIMEIHGGPHSLYATSFNYMHQNFAANGFVVLYINPRGSTGYGSEFGNAIERAYPGVDYEDLMVAVDTVVKRGFVDERRMYVGGCSGGGVLSSWVIGHTNRFAAAAVRCPVIDWMSFIGQTDVPLFTQNFFDKPFWEDPSKWLAQSSLMYVGKVTTPTMVMTGELDRRTPIAQSEEYYAALKMRGVPAALLRFEGGYHGTGSKPSNFMRTQLYMMSWYNRWTRPAADATPVATASGEK